MKIQTTKLTPSQLFTQEVLQYATDNMCLNGQKLLETLANDETKVEMYTKLSVHQQQQKTIDLACEAAKRELKKVTFDARAKEIMETEYTKTSTEQTTNIIGMYTT